MTTEAPYKPECSDKFCTCHQRERELQEFITQTEAPELACEHSFETAMKANTIACRKCGEERPELPQKSAEETVKEELKKRFNEAFDESESEKVANALRSIRQSIEEEETVKNKQEEEWEKEFDDKWDTQWETGTTMDGDSIEVDRDSIKDFIRSLLDIRTKKALGERCTKCSAPFENHHHRHIMRSGVYHSACYSKQVESEASNPPLPPDNETAQK